MRQPGDPSDRPALVGRRVVVRYRLHGPEHSATDVLGRLEWWSGDLLRVTSRHGKTVDIASSDVLAIKEIPPQTVARHEVRDLEAAAALGWQATDIRRLGGWLLRAAGGFTRRANSCLPLDDPGRSLSAAVDEMVHWYRERGLTPAFQVAEPLGQVLSRHLDALGWAAATNRTIVMTAPAADVAQMGLGLPAVQVSTEPDESWLNSYHYDGEDLPATAREVLVNADQVGFASIDDASGRIAIARAAVTDAPSGRRWVGITAVEVVSRARRRGLGTHIVSALVSWASRQGATDAYLQVAESNTAARTVYGRLGFVDHHAYHYRRITVRPRNDY